VIRWARTLLEKLAEKFPKGRSSNKADARAVRHVEDRQSGTPGSIAHGALFDLASA